MGSSKIFGKLMSLAYSLSRRKVTENRAERSGVETLHICFDGTFIRSIYQNFEQNCHTVYLLMRILSIS